MASLVTLAWWALQQAPAVPDLASRTAAWPEVRPAATWLLLVARQLIPPLACNAKQQRVCVEATDNMLPFVTLYGIASCACICDLWLSFMPQACV